MKRIISERGQITIPKALRLSLGFGPGTQLEFVEEDGRLIVRRVHERDALDRLIGLVPRTNVDAVVDVLRGPGWMSHLDEGTHS